MSTVTNPLWAASYSTRAPSVPILAPCLTDPGLAPSAMPFLLNLNAVENNKLTRSSLLKGFQIPSSLYVCVLRTVYFIGEFTSMQNMRIADCSQPIREESVAILSALFGYFGI